MSEEGSKLERLLERSISPEQDGIFKTSSSSPSTSLSFEDEYEMLSVVHVLIFIPDTGIMQDKRKTPDVTSLESQDLLSLE